MKIYFKTTSCHHFGDIVPVTKIGGKHEGKWMCRIRGPRVPGKSGVKTVYSAPSMSAANASIARFLHISPSNVTASNINEFSNFGAGGKAAVVSPPAKLTTALSPIKSKSPNRRRSEFRESLRKLRFALAHRRGLRPYHIFDDKTLDDITNRCPRTKAELMNCKGIKDTRFSHFGQDILAITAQYQDLVAVGVVSPAKVTPAFNAEQVELRESLRQLRKAFASRLVVPPYCIFDNSTLDEITVKFPTTQSELMQCYGIGPKRFLNFGSAILVITKRYSQRSHAKRNDEDDDEDDEIEVGGSLSCEDIVAAKFKEAETSGLVISI